jgi:long-chain acyl-CoA synthetase
VRCKTYSSCNLERVCDASSATLSFTLISEQVEEYGKVNLIEPIRATPETLASICYTSVSTYAVLPVPLIEASNHRVQQAVLRVTIPLFFVLSKRLHSVGAMLKHKNLALATQSNLYGLRLPADVCLLSYLPLAHIYEVTFD